MIGFTCPQCSNHVRLDLDEESVVAYLGPPERFIEAWCCTRHSKPVRMRPTDG